MSIEKGVLGCDSPPQALTGLYSLQTAWLGYFSPNVEWEGWANQLLVQSRNLLRQKKIKGGEIEEGSFGKPGAHLYKPQGQCWERFFSL